MFSPLGPFHTGSDFILTETLNEKNKKYYPHLSGKGMEVFGSLNEFPKVTQLESARIRTQVSVPKAHGSEVDRAEQESMEVVGYQNWLTYSCPHP